jgi:hypothetical protein
MTPFGTSATLINERRSSQARNSGHHVGARPPFSIGGGTVVRRPTLKLLRFRRFPRSYPQNDPLSNGAKVAWREERLAARYRLLPRGLCLSGLFNNSPGSTSRTSASFPTIFKLA